MAKSQLSKFKVAFEYDHTLTEIKKQIKSRIVK